MAQRSAQFTRPGEMPDKPSEGSSPTIATSVLDFAGIRFPRGGRK